MIENQIAVAKKHPDIGDRICIVGAGAAGVYMAYLLKQRGYKNVTVLEKENRIGGQCHTKVFHGVPHELGASMGNASYEDLVRLNEDLKLDELVQNPDERNIHVFQGEVHLLEDLVLGLHNQAGLTQTLLRPWKRLQFFQSCLKYIRIHEKIFGTSKYVYGSRPTVNDVNMTFHAFLKKHHLLNLTNFFRFLFSTQYGHLETTPALYGLWWCTPKMVRAVIEPMGRKRPTFLFRLKSGYQPFFEKLALKSEADILLGYQVDSIERKQTIRVNGKHQSRPRTLEFDFLIMACSAKQALACLDCTEAERDIFSKLEYTYPAMTVFTSKTNTSLLQGAGCIWFDMAIPGASPHKGVVNLVKELANYYNIEAVNDQNVPERVYVTFQHSERGEGPGNEEELNRALIADLVRKGFGEPEILYQCRWRYFPAFRQDAIDEGYPWKITEMQGENNTWHIGSSACFESVKDVMNYNQMLVATLLPKGECVDGQR